MLGIPPPQAVSIGTDLKSNKSNNCIWHVQDWLSLEKCVFMQPYSYDMLWLSRITHFTLVAVLLEVMLISKGATQSDTTPVFKRPGHLCAGRIRNIASCLKQSSYTIEALAPVMSSSQRTCCGPGKTGAWSQGGGSSGGSTCAGWSCTVSLIPITGSKWCFL